MGLDTPTSKELAPTSRRPVGRPRREGLDEQILDAALEEMSRVGFVRMNMDSVATRAGTTKTTLYARFPSKASLATSALEHMRRRTPRDPLTGDVRYDLIRELTLFRAGALRPHGMTMLGGDLAAEHRPLSCSSCSAGTSSLRDATTSDAS